MHGQVKTLWSALNRSKPDCIVSCLGLITAPLTDTYPGKALIPARTWVKRPFWSFLDCEGGDSQLLQLALAPVQVHSGLFYGSAASINCSVLLRLLSNSSQGADQVHPCWLQLSLLPYYTENCQPYTCSCTYLDS